jgi:hypothetical protein
MKKRFRNFLPWSSTAQSLTGPKRIVEKLTSVGSGGLKAGCNARYIQLLRTAVHYYAMYVDHARPRLLGSMTDEQ